MNDCQSQWAFSSKALCNFKEPVNGWLPRSCPFKRRNRSVLNMQNGFDVQCATNQALRIADAPTAIEKLHCVECEEKAAVGGSATGNLLGFVQICAVLNRVDNRQNCQAKCDSGCCLVDEPHPGIHNRSARHGCSLSSAESPRWRT